MRFHTQTAGVSLTAQQPLNNITRTAIEALAGVLGGTQSLHTNSYDEALALPTEDAVQIALRTQQIIAHETGVANTIDPLGGSYFVEALTDRIEAQAYEYFRRIDELGGMVEAVKRGYPQQEIADAAFELQQAHRRRRAPRRRRQQATSSRARRRSRRCGSTPPGGQVRSSACARCAPARDEAAARGEPRRDCARSPRPPRT